MRQSLFLCLFLFTHTITFSQIAKGDWLIGGSCSFSDLHETGASEIHQSTLNFNLDAGYFIAEKFAIGINLQWTKHFYKSETMEAKSSAFSPGVFARYYILKQEAAFNLFAEGSVDLLLEKGSQGSWTDIGYSVFIGPVVFLNDIVGLEFPIGYSGRSFAGRGQTNFLTAGIGLQLYYNR